MFEAGKEAVQTTTHPPAQHLSFLGLLKEEPLAALKVAAEYAVSPTWGSVEFAKLEQARTLHAAKPFQPQLLIAQHDFLKEAAYKPLNCDCLTMTIMGPEKFNFLKEGKSRHFTQKDIDRMLNEKR
jgi:hypothetical protein